MHRHLDGKPKRIRIAAHIGLGIAIATLVCLGFGFVVMQLWNAVLPDLLAVRSISYWQAVGLLVLCRLLVGGLHPFRRRPRRRVDGHGGNDALEQFVERGR